MTQKKGQKNVPKKLFFVRKPFFPQKQGKNAVQLEKVGSKLV